jgi:hypothetical protein
MKEKEMQSSKGVGEVQVQIRKIWSFVDCEQVESFYGNYNKHREVVEKLYVCMWETEVNFCFCTDDRLRRN